MNITIRGLTKYDEEIEIKKEILPLMEDKNLKKEWKKVLKTDGIDIQDNK